MGAGTREYQNDKWAAREGIEVAPPEPGSRAATAIEQIPREGLLIDLGCGDGALLRLAPSRKIGLDLSVIGLGRVPAGIPRVCADLDSPWLPFRDTCADAVTILDALPYVESPLRLFREIARIVKPGGRLIASAPNGRQLPRLLGLLAGRPIALSPEESPYDGGQRHIFTDRSMVLLMEATGFDCERVMGLLPVPPRSTLRALLRPIASVGIGRALLAPGVLVVGRRR
jgi:SAM-dependent methyltransferase